MSLKQIWQAANPKGHLLTAISFLIPIVCGSGFIIAIGMGLGGTVQDTLTPGQFDVWQAMATLVDDLGHAIDDRSMQLAIERLRYTVPKHYFDEALSGSTPKGDDIIEML